MRNLRSGLVAFSLFAAAAQSAELKGVIMFDDIKIEDSSLKLNGMGLRLATLFKVKVYVAGLYLETPSKDPSAILASTQTKAVEIEFLRDLEVDRIRDGWKEGFKKSCGTQCDSLSPMLETFLSLMTDMKKGERMRFVFRKGGTELYMKNALRGRVDGQPFAKVMLSIWLGDSPPNSELKQGMLGL